VTAGYTTKYWLETRWEYLLKVVALLKERCRKMSDFIDMSGYFFHSEFDYEEKAVKKRFNPEAAERLKLLADEYEKLDNFSKAKIEEILAELADRINIKKAELIHPTRLAVTGVSAGPGLFDILETVGQKEVIKRLKRAIEYIDNLGG
jgi:glutamyl-tRNA synthetase